MRGVLHLFARGRKEQGKIMTNPILTRTTRGGITDNIHRGCLAVVGNGKVVKAIGDIDAMSFLRSSSKPLQAATVVAHGAAEAFGLTDKEVAIIAGSHNGEPEHVETARSIFAKIGLSESLLQCGTHPPIHKESMYALLRAGVPFSAIHNNCSGKHAGMLALAKHLGAAVDASYIKPEHPVQKKNLEMISLLADYPAGKITLGVDGCGISTHGMPLRNMAIAFARAANPEGLPAKVAAACGRVMRAMWANPMMVAGHGRYCTALLAATGKKLFVKAGANGVYAIGVPGRGLGIAVKVDDGERQGYHALLIQLLRSMDVITDAEVRALGEWANPKILNECGEVAGHAEVVIEI